MFDPITIVVPGRAHGKVLKANIYSGGQYRDKKSIAYMTLVTSFAKMVLQGRAPVDEPIFIGLTEIREIPKSWTKRDKAAAMRGEIWPTSKPDLKNIMAGVEDAMNHFVWRDDALIVGYTTFQKIYGETPRLIVTIRSAESVKGTMDPGREQLRQAGTEGGTLL